MLKGAARDPIAKKVAMTDHKRLLEKFDRFNEDYVTAYIEDREVLKVKENHKKEKKMKESPLD